MAISTNMRAIDTIKSEILSEVANLYRNLAACDEIDGFDGVREGLATIIAMDYLLAKRLGIGFSAIDGCINELLNIAIDNNHELELEFSDMSELKKYINNR
ncbi:MAG: hypothetical protein IJT23_11390 [Clostridia bacterium]|nr:hypothetical protein [Clostridia bacterium]